MITCAIRFVGERKKHGLFYAAVFFCFLALYAVTAQRGVSWQDSGEYQYRVLAGDYQWHAGIARAHPLYIALARGFVALFPVRLCFYAANLFSGVGLALALALLASSVVRLTRSAGAAALAVGALGFAHMAWWLGTVAEVYTWSLAFLMAEILCLIRYAEGRDARWLVLLFGVNGAHLGLHNAALLGLPAYLFVLVSGLRRRGRRGSAVVCAAAVCWLSGAGLVAWQAVQLWLGTGDPLLVLKSVLFGEGYERQVLGTGAFQIKVWAANMGLAAVSLMNPCWVLAGRGFLAGGTPAIGAGSSDRGDKRNTGMLECGKNGGRRRVSLSKSHPSTLPTFHASSEVIDEDVLNGLRVLTVIHVIFWVRYFVPDQATFMLPTLGLLAVWVGVGASRSKLGVRSEERGAGEVSLAEEQRAQRVPPAGAAKRWLAIGVACAVGGPFLLREAIQRTGMTVARARTLPFREETSYWVIPWKQGEVSAARFVEEVGRTLQAGDTLVADSTAAAPLMAVRAAGTRTAEWRLVTPWSDESEGELRALVREPEGRVFVVSPVAGYAPRAVLDAEGFEREGVLYRVRNKTAQRANGGAGSSGGRE